MADPARRIIQRLLSRRAGMVKHPHLFAAVFLAILSALGAILTWLLRGLWHDLSLPVDIAEGDRHETAVLAAACGRPVRAFRVLALPTRPPVRTHAAASGRDHLGYARVGPSAWDRYKDIKLLASDGVDIDTALLRDEVACLIWRVRPTRVSVGRLGPGLFDRLPLPAEPAFGENSPVRGIEVRHRPHCNALFGVDFPWWGTFLVVSMLAGLIARGPLGVQF